MSVLNIEGAKLSYQKVGQGPILILYREQMELEISFYHWQSN